MHSLTRRALLALTASMSIVIGSAAQAQDKTKEVVIGGSLPLTGVFAFAGKAIEAGMQDYIKIANENKAIKGYKIRLNYEDTGYKVDRSVAVFNKLMSDKNIHLYYGDSTGFAKTINPELGRRGTIMMAGASFGSELNNPTKYPYQFIAGPDYSEMIAILLEYIAKEKPGAKIVLVNSDTEFGRDPVAATKKRAKELGLNIVEQISTAPGAVDVSTEILKLRRARPDYTIFHGYVLAPIPEFMSQARALGLKTKFMGTFWSMDSAIWNKVGKPADGFMGVMPYRYYYDDAADATLLKRIRKMRPKYQSTGYMQGFMTAMLMVESAKRVISAGKEMNGKNLKAALNSIKDFNTGGIIGTPITVTGNTVSVGRIYQYNADEKRMKPVSRWIKLD